METQGQEVVCVTGASGGLGRALVPRLVARSCGVIGLSRHGPAPGAGPFVRYFAEEIATVAWEQVLADVSTVFHLAAAVHQCPRTPVEEARCFEVNNVATERLASACRGAGSTLVYASTVAVLGAARTAYARSKLLAEEAIRREGERGLRFVILRFPLLYGPHGRGNMERLVRQISRGRYWPIDGPDVRKSCLYLGDAGDALVQASDTDEALGRTFVVAPDQAVTLDEIHRAIYAATGRRQPRPSIPPRAALSAAGGLDLCARAVGRRTRFASQVRTLTESAVFDGWRFAAATGFTAQTDLAAGLRETVRWLRESSAPAASGRRVAEPHAARTTPRRPTLSS
jgi:UDP-glucose 4-epimerase